MRANVRLAILRMPKASKVRLRPRRLHLESKTATINKIVRVVLVVLVAAVAALVVLAPMVRLLMVSTPSKPHANHAKEMEMALDVAPTALVVVLLAATALAALVPTILRLPAPPLPLLSEEERFFKPKVFYLIFRLLRPSPPFKSLKGLLDPNT